MPLDNKQLNPGTVSFSACLGNSKLEKMTSASLRKSSEELNKEVEMLEKEETKFQRRHSREVRNIQKFQKSLKCSSGHAQPELPKIVIDDSFARKQKRSLQKSTSAAIVLEDYEIDSKATLDNDSDSPGGSSQSKDLLFPPKIHARRHSRMRTDPLNGGRKLNSKEFLGEEKTISPFSVSKQNGSTRDEIITNKLFTSSPLSLKSDHEEKRRYSLPSTSMYVVDETATNPSNSMEFLSVPRTESVRRRSLPSEILRMASDQKSTQSSVRKPQVSISDEVDSDDPVRGSAMFLPVPRIRSGRRKSLPNEINKSPGDQQSIQTSIDLPFENKQRARNSAEFLSVPRIRSGQRKSLPNKHYGSAESEQSAQASTNLPFQKKSNAQLRDKETRLSSEMTPRLEDPRECAQSHGSNGINVRETENGFTSIHSSIQSSVVKNTTASPEGKIKPVSVVTLEFDFPGLYFNNNSSTLIRNTKGMNNGKLKSVNDVVNSDRKVRRQSQSEAISKRIEQIFSDLVEEPGRP